MSLKIGIHHGAAIAVTLNDELDYFGQTVNIASRVQEMADAARSGSPRRSGATRACRRCSSPIPPSRAPPSSTASSNR